MVTLLDKERRRLVTVDGADYTLTVHPKGFRLTAKGKRKPEVKLLWRELLSGEAALAVALNASLGVRSKASAATVSSTTRGDGKRATGQSSSG